MKIPKLWSFLAFKYIFLSGLAAWFCESALCAYTIGDRVEANGTVNVRQTPAGTFLNTQPNGSQGAVIGGPTVASLNGTSYTWWNINFDAGQDGWVADIGLISAPPTVQTFSAASIAITSAQLRGSIAPNGSSTSAYFQYGTSTSYGNSTSSGNFGTTSQTIALSVSGLSANTTYHYRLVAQNGTGTTLGNDVTFTTSPQPVPTVSTLAATLVTLNSATLNGTVNPNGAISSFYFEYGTTAGYGTSTSVGNTSISVNVGAPISGLSPNTTYHFRFVASNSGGTTFGNDVTFTTASQPVPTVSTLAATLVTLNSATLNGTVNPNGAISSFYFDYGTTAGYGTSTSVGNTSISVNVGAPISGLSQNTLYHFRFVASNSGGTTFGSDATFTTQGQPVPTVQTLPASSVMTTSATLNGSINPNGATTTAYFQYGTSTAYGSNTISGNFGTNALIIGTSVTGLGAGITYHYRIVASNSGGTNVGNDATFITTSLPTGPIVQTLAATMQTASSVQLNGYLNPNGLNTSAYFEYGINTGYGASTPTGNFGTTPQNIGYTLTALAPNTMFHYRITASNANGTSHGNDSTFATGTPPGSAAPSIVTQPQSQTAQAGTNVTFSVAITGSTPISYQWLKSGTALSGQTSPTLTLNSVSTFDSDGYSVVVNNPYGTVTSATAWLAVYAAPLNSPPPPPVTVATNRAQEQPSLVQPTSTQLEVFSGTSFVTNQGIDPSKMTIVFTHGWNSTPQDWPQEMASNMIAGHITNANLVAWNWTNAADTGLLRLSVAFSATPGQGQALGQALASTLGSSYGKPIHFIGHSLGTLVNATAANYLHEQTGGAFDPTKTHMTLLDEAEIANDEGVGLEFGSYALPTLEALAGENGVPVVGWVAAVPHRYGWIDNYVSLVGGLHPEAVNVFLSQSIFRTGTINPVTFIINAHGYACSWYGMTASDPLASILGNRYSFEQLGFNTSPAQASPYPSDSLFAQAIYPTDEFSLHDASQLELADFIIRQAGLHAPYQFLSGVSTLDQIGQTVGNAYMNLVTSSAAVVSDASSVTSQFFYSIQATLNSGTASQSQMKLGGFSPSPMDAGSSNGPPGVWLPIQVPSNAVVLSFDFSLTGTPGSDIFTANVNGTNIFALEAQFIPQNQRLNSGSIPISAWAGQSVELFFGLTGGTSSNATVTVDAMRFYQLAPPTLSITAANGQVVISWPANTQGFALQSANSLDANTSWSTITNMPATNGLWNVVTNPITGTSEFYRLTK